MGESRWTSALSRKLPSPLTLPILSRCDAGAGPVKIPILGGASSSLIHALQVLGAPVDSGEMLFFTAVAVAAEARERLEGVAHTGDKVVVCMTCFSARNDVEVDRSAVERVAWSCWGRVGCGRGGRGRSMRGRKSIRVGQVFVFAPWGASISVVGSAQFCSVLQVLCSAKSRLHHHLPSAQTSRSPRL